MLKIFSPKLRGGSSGLSVSSIDGMPCIARSHVNELEFQTKKRSNATHSDKVHLVGTPEGRAHVHCPADPEGKEDGDVDVRCEEVLRVPHEEDLVSDDEDEDRRPKDTPYSQTWLQRRPVHELGTIKSLYFVTAP